MAIKFLPNNLKPREKALLYGIKQLTDVELLAIILRTGTKKVDVINLANNILIKSNGLNNLINYSYQQLLAIEGIGQVKALEIQALIQLTIRINKIKIEKYVYAHNPELLFQCYQKRFENIKQEHFIILSLDSQNAVIDEKTIFVGTLSQSLIHPREIFKQIILNSAAAFICLHNHPSGECLPSQEDIKITELLNETALLFAIPFLDHIIIGKETYFSFKENEMI